MKLTVSVLSQEPIYEQIKQQIREQVYSGELLPGMQLPSIRAMAKELKIGVITSKRAYDDLCEEGILTSHPGKGVFVSQLDTGQIKSAHLGLIMEQLADIVDLAKSYSVSRSDVYRLLDKIYEGDEENE